MSSFKWGRSSLKRRANLCPTGQKVIDRALEITTQDISVFETLRTLSRQRALVARGASKTLHSWHLPGPDGKARAADVVAFTGRLSWDVSAMYKVCAAMVTAAQELGAKVKWGGCWRYCDELDASDLAGAISDYVKLRVSQGRKPFVDMAHFQFEEELEEEEEEEDDA